MLNLKITVCAGLVFCLVNANAWASGAAELAKENKKRQAKEASQELKKSVKSYTSYFSMQPSIYTQYQRDKKHMGYIRVELQLKLDSEASSALVEENQPALTSTFIDLIAEQPEGALRSLKGREALRGQAKERLRQTMEEITGEGVIEDVFFTKYLAD